MHRINSAVIAFCLLLLTHQSITSAEPDTAASKLESVLASQSNDIKARYQYRHPKETLLFFELKPGMTVVEALPGEGWYSKILVPYLGQDGHLVGVDYAMDMWPKFNWANKEFIEERQSWPASWPAEVNDWKITNSSKVSAYTFKTLPKELTDTVDAVLFIRALHNLSRFESDGAYFSNTLKESYRVLKPGGILGIVQHASSIKTLDGSTGYLEKTSLIKRIENLGFKFVAESDINNNAKDQPEADEIVWRLPPALYTSKDNPELQKKYKAIGESNRMTLKFVKPAV